MRLYHVVKSQPSQYAGQNLSQPSHVSPKAIMADKVCAYNCCQINICIIEHNV